MSDSLNRRLIACLGSILILLAMGEPVAPQPGREITFASLKQGQVVSGFKTEAVYLNDSESPFGARFKHEKTGFTLDLFQIQTLPQAFIWVNTLLSSDNGAAHTQEHLLLGKGHKGRQHGTRVSMSLIEESAGTDQWRTYYHFNTAAGAEVFYELLGQYLDLLLNPDYTDEEIRREVRNFAVKEESRTKSLVLAEKGTVYNEMVSSSRSPQHVVWYGGMKALYGPGHPLACINGGSPEGIRGLTPAEIRRFHKCNYRLDNMGMITACPKEMAPGTMLGGLNDILSRLHSRPARTNFNSERPQFPAPRPAAPGGIQIFDFPSENARKPGNVYFAWPPRLKLSSRDRLLLSLFLTSLAGESDTPLYKLFVDSKTLKTDSGATGVGAWLLDQQGFPVLIGMDDVAQSHINKKDISHFRGLIQAEIRKAAAWKDGSAELAEFNANLLGRLAQFKRGYTDFVNKPFGFGVRGNSGSLMKHLFALDEKGGFRRSVTLKTDFVEIESLLARKTNIWRTCLARWQLLEEAPYVFASRPSPRLIASQKIADESRLQAESARLEKAYAVTDRQAALRAYKKAYDAETFRLEELSAKDTGSCKFVDSPPLTADDQLEYKISSLPGGIPLLSSFFESMTSSQTSLRLRLDGVATGDLIYLTLLPQLLRQTGVIENGKAISHDEMLKRIRRDIFFLNTSFNYNPNTSRCELNLCAAGTSVAESKNALNWMKLILEHPNWRPENLHRIRDVVEQSLSGLRSTRDSGYEDSWDYDVAASYRRQDNPLLLNTQCFLTRTHNAQRLRWLLKGDADPESLKSFVAFMKVLKKSGSTRRADELKNLLNTLARTSAQAVSLPPAFAELSEPFGKLRPAARALLADAADDLLQDLPDIPESSLSDDWQSLCAEIAADIQVPPAQTLAKLDSIRASLLCKGGARLTITGSPAMLAALQEPLKQLADTLAERSFTPVLYPAGQPVVARLYRRLKLDAGSNRPLFAGLVNPGMQQGVVINSAPAIKYQDIDEESLKGALCLNLYGGAGAHSLFMKTWGAGLAYGNGPSWSCNSRLTYYADKMPSIPETLRFVAAELKKAKPDPRLKEYAIALCFYSRAGGDFGGRCDSLADDLADNVPPDTVRRFRSAMLQLGKKEGLIDELYAVMLRQYGKVIPDLGVKAGQVPGAVHLSIGDEKQLSAYENYLKSVESPDSRIYRLYARDFWINALKTEPDPPPAAETP
jgi:Zn-dependent M16 (insulinase) family peptidase